MVRTILAAAIALTAGATGCAQPKGPLFTPLASTRVWPPPPDIARIQYVGAIASSDDLNAATTVGQAIETAFVGTRPPIRFAAPRALAVSRSDMLAVADDAAVHILDLNERTHRIVTGFADQRFLAPVAVAWLGDRLLVSDAQRAEIVECDALGGCFTRIGAGELTRPVGVAVPPAGDRIIVVDGGDHCVKLFAVDGRRLQTVGRRGSADGEFNYPSHLCATDSQFLVSDSGNNRIQTLDAGGAFINRFGRQGDAAGDLALPKGVAVDADGHVYVVDARFENVQIFTPDGQLLLAFGHEGGGPGEFSLPAGIAIDHRNRVWVADTANARVQVFQYLGDPS